MITAKTQSKLDQWLAKQDLRELLKVRSTIHHDDDLKEARQELDMRIHNKREFLHTNKLVLPAKKAIKRGSAKAAAD